MDERDFVLASDQTPVEAGVGAVAVKARGYSIAGALLRGYEVVAITPETRDDEGQLIREEQVEVLMKVGPKHILKAEQEAKHAFNRESKRDEDKRRGIRIRYLISIDPTIIEERT